MTLTSFTTITSRAITVGTAPHFGGFRLGIALIGTSSRTTLGPTVTLATGATRVWAFGGLTTAISTTFITTTTITTVTDASPSAVTASLIDALWAGLIPAVRGLHGQQPCPRGPEAPQPGQPLALFPAVCVPIPARALRDQPQPVRVALLRDLR